jgi:WD40 repeat protein
MFLQGAQMLRNGLGFLILLAVIARPAAGQTSKGQSNKTSPVLTPKTRLTDFPEWVSAVAFSPDGKRLTVGGFDFLQQYDTDGWEKRPIAELTGAVGSLVYLPGGRQLLVGGYQKIDVFDVVSGKVAQSPAFSLLGHRGLVTDLVCISKTQIISASDDETARVWDVTSRSEVLKIDVGEPVQSVAVAGDLIATASGDPTRTTRPGQVKIWNRTTGQPVRDCQKPDKAGTGVSFSPDGKYLISTAHDGLGAVHDVSTGQVVGQYEGHARPTRGVVVLPGKRVATISGGDAVGKNELAIWELKTQKELVRLEAHEGPIVAVAQSADGRLLATGSHDKTVAVFNVAMGSKKPETIAATPNVIRVGMIGLDTSHCGAFTKVLNDPKAKPDVAGFKVVCAYPYGSKDIESSASRIPKYTEDMKKLGVEITESIDDLLAKVDVVLLETNDGRLHLKQFLACAKAGKPVFIDKPVAAQLDDVIAIYELAKRYDVPLFSSSSLRFATGVQEATDGRIGDILGCDAFSPCPLEKTHSDLFWYGIHGVETLFAAMGTGCETVQRTSTTDFEVVTGTWSDGRIGTFRGLRSGKLTYGGTAFGSKGVQSLGGYSGYRPLVVEIAKFFKTRKSPVPAAETIQLYAFMAAAADSKANGGTAVKIADVVAKAEKSAAEKLAKPGVKPAVAK